MERFASGILPESRLVWAVPFGTSFDEGWPAGTAFHVGGSIRNFV